MIEDGAAPNAENALFKWISITGFDLRQSINSLVTLGT